jgi:hypothetical protein
VPSTTLSARLAAVAPAAPTGASGRAREATLSLLPASAPPPLYAGEPCRVEVEVARRTPADLLFAALRPRDAANP